MCHFTDQFQLDGSSFCLAGLGVGLSPVNLTLYELVYGILISPQTGSQPSVGSISQPAVPMLSAELYFPLFQLDTVLTSASVV